MKISGVLQLKNRYSAEWEAENPVLDIGEPGFDLDTQSLKIGDGATGWSDLPSVNVRELSQLADDSQHRLVTDAEKAKWNTTVDISGKADKDLGNVTLSKNMSQNGYYKAPDGLMIQWGRATVSKGSATVYFPTAFYTSTGITIMTEVLSVYTNEPHAYTIRVYSSSATNFVVNGTDVTSLANNWLDGDFMWMAIGRWK